MFTAMNAPTEVGGLQILWFLLIAVLWIGFFFLEGFDFGVGMLYQILSRKQPEERRVMVNSIGPMWDANQVWLLTAGGATFAAFPGWYASLFSGLYLPLFLVLVGLIIRGISFEYRALNPGTRWKNAFDWCNSIGSLIVVLVFGVGFANFVRGINVTAVQNAVAGKTPGLTWTTPTLLQSNFDGRFWGLFMPFCIVGGLMLIAMCLAHGAQFLTLKTSGTVLKKAEAFAPKISWIAAVLVAIFVIWGTASYATNNPYTGTIGVVLRWIIGIISIVLMVGAGVFVSKKRFGLSFICTGLSIATLFISIFVAIFGTLGFVADAASNSALHNAASTTFTGAAVDGYSIALNMTTTSSSHLTLVLMSVFAILVVPVILYTIWAYSHFTKRLSVENLPAEESEPAAAATV
ncbi:MAG: cytochrome d ubiquinol oxidase subunit II [Propionibacteriaceae bacterium]|nr:cytochrome d ubiquinol oxidase subunit II [Propionibacteriaceae bacterium]